MLRKGLTSLFSKLLNASSESFVPKICIIIPYFGKWPFWMAVFLESCRYNDTIDWLFYTDCGVPESCPSNVKVRQISFGDYCEKVSTSLKVNFRPESHYKLCDLKPMLGYVHADEIDGYDFWGFGDIDLVYSDLREYFSSFRLRKKDLFSTHQRRVSGHLCLIRNTDEMCTAFMKVKNWQVLLLHREHVAFDEKAFGKIFLRHKNSPLLFRWIAKKLDPWLDRAEFQEAYTTPNAKVKWLDGTNDYPKKWYWKAGRVSNDRSCGHQSPYFHFMVWKKRWSEPTTCAMLNLGKLKDGVVFTEAGVATGSIDK